MDPVTLAALINAIPLAFICFMFVRLERRIDRRFDALTARIDRLYETFTARIDRLYETLPKADQSQ